jgi:hypothetical protein
MVGQAGNKIEVYEVASGKGYLQPQPTSTVEQAAEQVIDLDSRARKIAYGATQQMRGALDAALACGQWLMFAKGKLPHGQWLPWLASVGVSQPSAWRYVKLAENYSERNSLLSATNVTHAMELAGIRKPKEPTEGKPSAHDKSGKTRLPDTLESVNAAFMRWQAQGFDERLEGASDALLCEWEALLRPMAQTYERVKARLKA